MARYKDSKDTFTLPVADPHVTLEVYNSLGNKVGTFYTSSVQANTTTEYPVNQKADET